MMDIMVDIFVSIIPLLIVVIFLIVVNSAHLLRGTYIWQYSKPFFYLNFRLYMKYEYAIMKMVLKLGSMRIFQRFRFFRLLLLQLISVYANGEVYSLEECLNILETLYKDYPHVYVALRICCCRQSRGIYDKDCSNITDLTFVYSKTPGVKKHMKYTTFVSLDDAKRLLKKFDKEGFVHTMFGGCAKLVDGSVNLSICNCKRNICIPMDLHIDYDAFNYQNPHNLAINDQTKCKGWKDCGKCLEVCHFEARVKEANGKIKILSDKCQGCALCVHHCPNGANRIKFLPKNKILFYQNLFKDIRKEYKNKEKSLA